jgi:hypothetical protein
MAVLGQGNGQPSLFALTGVLKLKFCILGGGWRILTVAQGLSDACPSVMARIRCLAKIPFADV